MKTSKFENICSAQGVDSKRAIKCKAIQDILKRDEGVESRDVNKVHELELAEVLNEIYN